MSDDTVRTTKNTNKKSTTGIIGVTTLVAGVLIGLAAMKYTGGKSTAMAATRAAKPAAVSPALHRADSAAWNPFQEIRDMQLRMDHMFDQMTTEFHAEPKLGLFPDNPGYSLSLHVQDLKDHFQVRAYLPNAKASDVRVSLLNKKTLKVDVSNKSNEVSTQKNATADVTEWGQYSQIIQLPAPVKSEQMKVDNQNHELLITLPKA
jgi:HSP20 family molecular chaperone IbpA